MLGESFYQTSSQLLVPVRFFSKDEWQNNAANLDSYDKKILEMQNFSGSCHDVVVVFDANANLKIVYVGVEDNNFSLSLANAALKIPVGAYKLVQKISSEDLIFWALAQYKFNHYKKDKIKEEKPRVLIIETEQMQKILPMVDAIFTVRNLINEPANVCNPEYLTEYVQKLGKKFKGKFEKWIGKSLLKHNFPAIHAVGRASAFEPGLLSLTFGDETHPLITIVGKGVCFDTGGLDIKPAEYMRYMKKDMGGAALVIGLAQWILNVQLPVRLKILIPVVENSVSANSYRPGDVLTMRNGLSVEIDNTDAEGRLVLGDALVKACEDKPDLVIDFATLTGAARVAVGTDISAMFCNDDVIADEVLQAAKIADDPVLRLPLFKGYESLLNSNVADISNCGKTSFAGAITAALFLQRFIKDTSWVHFDVMAWNLSAKPGKPEGGEAMAIRAVAIFLLNRYIK